MLPRFRAVAVETRADGSPVTEADKAAERAIRARLREAFPGFAIHGGASSSGKHGGLVVELRDPRSQRTFWHGWAAETWYDSMDPAVEIREAVALILAQYPDAEDCKARGQICEPR